MCKINDEYKLIEAGTMGRPFDKKDMVFCMIYCNEGRQYENYDYFLNSNDAKIREKAQMKVPTVLTITRFDGKRGFVGGNVEKYHNSLIEALRCELEEELNLTDIDESRLEPLSTFANSKSHITTYIYRVSYEELLRIEKNSIHAKHRYSEVCGVDLLQLHELSINNLRNTVFAGTGLDELNLLIEKESIGRSPLINKALALAKLHFEPKLRNNGRNYFEDHILKVYNKVIELGYGEKFQLVAILHDMLEDTNVTHSQLSELFGEDIADAVQILTIDKGICCGESAILEFSAVKKATEHELTRVVRFADRLSNLEQTSFKTNSNTFIERLVRKTIAYYIPNFEGEFELALRKEVMRLKSEVNFCPCCYTELVSDIGGFENILECPECGEERDCVYL